MLSLQLFISVTSWGSVCWPELSHSDSAKDFECVEKILTYLSNRNADMTIFFLHVHLQH